MYAEDTTGVSYNWHRQRVPNVRIACQRAEEEEEKPTSNINAGIHAMEEIKSCSESLTNSAFWS